MKKLLLVCALCANIPLVYGETPSVKEEVQEEVTKAEQASEDFLKDFAKALEELGEDEENQEPSVN